MVINRILNCLTDEFYCLVKAAVFLCISRIEVFCFLKFFSIISEVCSRFQFEYTFEHGFKKWSVLENQVHLEGIFVDLFMEMWVSQEGLDFRTK